MTRLDTLRSLQQRIREATGPDRKLDLEICRAFDQPMGWSGDIDGLGSHRYTIDPDGLGACVALMREVLPGKPWTKTASGRFRIWGDDVSLVLQSNPLHCLSDADPLANDCLTFIDAIISAAIAEEEAKEANQ